jgi:DNA helicase-2/ATP-dependent DNA helicase PcrA
LKIIERKMQSFTAPLLTLREYILLGKKRAPHFLYDREEIYKIAEYYQNILDERGLWDEIDLSKRALQLIGSSSDYAYDLVVCDEVQDFADVQLSLIFRFARSHRFIFLAGDMKQVINPSGFRWEEVRNKFYERGVQVPEVVNLNLNFRCVGNIVRLANRLLDLKRELVGLSGDETREEWKFNGKPPFLIHGIPESEMKGQIMITGAGQIVLARSNAEQSKLKKALGTELVFTVHEAKGLEFDTVMLWKFCQDKKSKEIWRKIKYNHHFDERQYPHIKHELNLLYVAVTRARNTLIIYDGSAPADIWETTQLQDLVYRTSESDALTGAWQYISSPSEWKEQGDYFFKREFYSAAVECYKNAGNISKKEIAELQFSWQEEAQGSGRAV